jgi:hypothetical protein
MGSAAGAFPNTNILNTSACSNIYIGNLIPQNVLAAGDSKLQRKIEQQMKRQQQKDGL